jgi:hypothetical protein
MNQNGPTNQSSPAVLAAAAILLAAAGAQALVNPNFTVVDLRSASSEILAVDLDAPADGKLTATVRTVLLGPKAEPDKPRTIILRFGGSEQTAAEFTQAVRGSDSRLAMLFVRKRKSEDGDVIGSLQVGTQWFGLIRIGPDQWDVVADPDDLETVWAGSADQLLRAVQYVLSDRGASFPVGSELTWIDSEKLGTLKGDARGMLATGDGVIVLGQAGDRIYRPGSQNAGPKDITEQMGLASASRLMAPGDFNGDGLADLASWDGETLRLVPGKQDGTFSPPAAGSQLAGLRYLTSLGPTLIAADNKGVCRIVPDGRGKWTTHRLPGPANESELGDGGPALVADLNDDGRCDILHVRQAGLVFYAGTEEDQRFAEPVAQKLPVMQGPAEVICGDYDGDGRLDLFVAGRGGAAMFSRNEQGRWKNVTFQTGELDAAVGTSRTQANLTAACPADLRGDGRQSVAVFSNQEAPGLFYARGFGCFAIAISLTRAQEEIEGYDALSQGQQAGLVVDLNGDRAPDLFGVDLERNVWAVFTEPDRLRRFAVTVGIAPAAGPVTLRAAMGSRRLGVYVVRPHRPQTIVLPRAGKVTLTWKTPDGQTRRRDVVVVRPMTIDRLDQDPPTEK